MLFLLQKYFFKYKRPKEGIGKSKFKVLNLDLKFAKLKMENKILKSKTAKAGNHFSNFENSGEPKAKDHFS